MNELIITILCIWVAGMLVDIWDIRRSNKRIKLMGNAIARAQKNADEYKQIIREYLDRTKGHILVKEEDYDNYVKAVDLYETQVKGNAWILLAKTINALIKCVQDETIGREQMAQELTRLHGIIEEELAVTQTEHILKTT